MRTHGCKRGSWTAVNYRTSYLGKRNFPKGEAKCLQDRGSVPTSISPKSAGTSVRTRPDVKLRSTTDSETALRCSWRKASTNDVNREQAKGKTTGAASRFGGDRAGSQPLGSKGYLCMGLNRCWSERECWISDLTPPLPRESQGHPGQDREIGSSPPSV